MAPVEEGAEAAACLELMDLLLQGLPLLLGCGMAVVEEGEDDDDDGGEVNPEVAAEMLVEELTVTADDRTCSVIPSEESAGHGHFKAEVLKYLTYITGNCV